MKHNLMISILYSALIIFFTATDAHAYIDPGTGGLFYQIVVLIIGAIAGYFAIFKNLIKNFFAKKEKKPDEDKP